MYALLIYSIHKGDWHIQHLRGLDHLCNNFAIIIPVRASLDTENYPSRTNIAIMHCISSMWYLLLCKEWDDDIYHYL